MGEKESQLVDGRGCARFVDMDELIGLQAEHIGERVASAPRSQQITDARQRVATLLQSSDELQPSEVAGVVQPDPT